jgi:hypothetical protein
MDLLDIRAREIHLVYSITAEEVKDLKTALDHAEFHFNLENKEHQQANDFIHEIFYPFIKSCLEKVDKNGS